MQSYSMCPERAARRPKFGMRIPSVDGLPITKSSSIRKQGTPVRSPDRDKSVGDRDDSHHREGWDGNAGKRGGTGGEQSDLRPLFLKSER